MNTPYGSAVYSEGTGVLLNNEMADFSTPGQRDVFNLPPAEANFIRRAAAAAPLDPTSPAHSPARAQACANCIRRSQM